MIQSSDIESAIELDDLSVALGGRLILKALNARVTGRAVGLLGPNGAGKTTLIHTLLGFYPAASGTARILGKDIFREAKAVRGMIGYMPERDAFIAKMSCVQFVRLMGELSGLPSRAALERAHEALFYVGLGEARYRTLETFSLGMKQLAKLAQAIVHGPPVLLLDEPTNGLDPPARQRMIRLIREIRDSGRARILISSHLLRDVEECCEEIIVLKGGKIVVSSNLEEERRTNQRFLIIETRGNNELFKKALGGLGCEYALSTDRKMKVILPKDVEIKDLFALAAQHSVQLRNLSYKRDSLEEIFLKAMEERPVVSV